MHRLLLLAAAIALVALSAIVHTADAASPATFNFRQLRKAAKTFNTKTTRQSIAAQFAAIAASCDDEFTAIRDDDESASVRAAYEACALAMADAYAAAIDPHTARVTYLMDALLRPKVKPAYVCDETATIVVAMMQHSIPYYGATLDTLRPAKQNTVAYTMAASIAAFIEAQQRSFNESTCAAYFDQCDWQYMLDRLKLVYFQQVENAQSTKTDYTGLYSRGGADQAFGHLYEGAFHRFIVEYNTLNDRKDQGRTLTDAEKSRWTRLQKVKTRPYQELVDAELDLQEAYAKIALDLEDAHRERMKVEEAAAKAAEAAAKAADGL
jgi:hypothetical protein